LKTTVKKIMESLVPWKAKALLAKPGVSLNNRNWTKEELQRIAPKYAGRLVMTDHGELCGQLVGVNTTAYYGQGSMGEGLYAEAIGLMEPELFEKIKGLPGKGIPPLLKGVSMGGQGDLERKGGVDTVTNFEPLEWSFTPFPGIPDAQVLQFAEIKESLQQRQRMIESGSYGPGHVFARVDLDLFKKPSRKR